MGSSSGSGSYVFGGSLSSSTLSPLAPPFNIDKSLLKPNSINASLNSFDAPVYGTVFDPAGQLWNSPSSSASRPNYVVTETTGTNTTCTTPPAIYDYQAPHSSKSSAVYYVNSDLGAGNDTYSYGHFQSNMTTGADETAKPFYPSYVYPPPQKDGYLGLGVGTGSGYDLLSNSNSASLSGYGSSHIDHTQGLSVDGDSRPKWDQFWTGENDGEWKGFAQGLGSKGVNFSGLSGSKSHLSLDVSNKSLPFVDGSNQIHPFSERSDEGLLKQGSCPILDVDDYRNVSTNSGSFYEIFGGAYPSGSQGIGQQNGKASLDLNLGGISADCWKMPAFASVPASNESHHLQESVLESITSLCGAQTASAPDYCFNHTGSFVFSSTSTTSTPISMNKLPYNGSGSNFVAQSTFLGTKGIHSDASYERLPSTGLESSVQKEPQIFSGLKCQSNVVIKRPLSSFNEPSSSQIGKSVNKIVDKDASDTIKLFPEVPHQFPVNGFGREVDDAETIYSVEKHAGESDVHNPAEDSPCWKGASSTRFSPFGVYDSVFPVVLGKNLDGDNISITQEIQNGPVLADTSNSLDLSSAKVNESSSFKRPSNSTCSLKDHEDSSPISLKRHSFNLNNGAELHYGDECCVNTEESYVLNKTKTDPDSSLVTKQILKDGDTSSDRNISEAAEAEKKGHFTASMAYGFSEVQPNNDSDLYSSPLGDKSSLKFCQSPGKVSDSRTDVNVLLKTMMDMSEVLRDSCVSNPAVVVEQHAETIRHIVDNLNACLSLMNGLNPSSMLVSSQRPSCQKEAPASEMVSPHDSVAAAVKLSRRTVDFLDSFPFNDDLNAMGNDNMIEAIKKILLENIEKEEIDQHKPLYKYLWLEAEAALCAMTAKARLHRMKIEIEKPCDSTKDTFKPPVSNNSSDVHSKLESTSKDENSPALVDHDRSSLRTSATSQCEDYDVNKFHAPNSRVSLNSMVTEGLKSTREEEICPPSLHTNSSCTSGNNCDDSGTIGNANDLAASVMARYQILRDRTDLSDSLNYTDQQSLGEDGCLLENDYSSPEYYGKYSRNSGPNSHANHVETPAMTRYQIIKGRDDRPESLNSVLNQSSGEEVHLPDNVFTEFDKPFQDSQSNSFDATDDCEASVMGRFRILQSQNILNSMDKYPTLNRESGSSPDVAAQVLGWSKQVGPSFFGPYPNFTRCEEVKDFGVCANEVEVAALTQSCEANNLSSKILEGWYDNGCPSSEWEHVSKEDIQSQH